MQEETRSKDKTKVKNNTKPIENKQPKWNLNQNDYIELLRSIEINAQALLNIQGELNKIKRRLGLGEGVWKDQKKNLE